MAADHGNDMKNTVLTFKEAKQTGRKISMVTAYDYSMARLVDEAGIDAILVGDSLGNVVLGYEDTCPVTMDEMVHHTKAVTRGTEQTFVVADMPFLSYQTSVYDAVVNAGRLIKDGRAQAVKLEGGTDMADRIEAIVKAQIPVMAHLGLTPQSVNSFGGYKVQGRAEQDARKLVESAKAVEAAGAFSVVLECVPADLAAYVSSILTIPTIGIGAGAGCDGQVLVYHDMMGITRGHTAKFVKKFAEAGDVMVEALKEYKKEVEEQSFPAKEHTYKIDAEVMEKIKNEQA